MVECEHVKPSHFKPSHSLSLRIPPHPSAVRDEEWAFVAPYLTLSPEDAGQRRSPLREVFNAVRYLVRTGVHWRLLPHDVPPWPVVYQ